MKRSLLKLYHCLPPVMRGGVASARGYYLRHWRYGRDTDQLVEMYREREQWSAEQWSLWQRERLAQVLHRAATCVPYYRDQWAERRRRGDKSDWTELENWPILEKDVLRAHAKLFVADDCDHRRMFHEHTSGTTGKSLDLWWSRSTVREWYAVSELRTRLWYGVSRHDRWAILGGQLVTPAGATKPPFWVWNAGLNQLYMSSYHLSARSVPHYVEALKRYRIKYIFGYSSSLHALAQEMLAQGCSPLPMQVAMTNAEPLFDYQRRDISAAFGCPVRETYGMAELVAGASECEAGHLHLWPCVGHIEVMEGSEPQATEQVGQLVCTGLLNTDMPLIRYRVGDRGAVRAADATCACGRTLPLLSSLEGRCDDTLYTTDGRRIGRLDPVFKSQLPVREAQIIQIALDRLRIRYVPAPGFGDDHARSLIQRVRDRMGPVEVELEAVDRIPRTAAGKFRAVVCQLPPEQLAAVASRRQVAAMAGS